MLSRAVCGEREGVHEGGLWPVSRRSHELIAGLRSLVRLSYAASTLHQAPAFWLCELHIESHNVDVLEPSLWSYGVAQDH